MGYENVASLAGGFRAWQQGGYSIDAPRTLDEQQMMRYSRHLTLPQVGLDGQMKLLNSRVLLIGAGGLGSPSAFYLAAAGIGTLGIIDDDVVDESNLQRQIAHTTYRVGINKAESARDSLKALNPSIEIIPYPFRLKHQQIMDVFADYDVVVDGTDNFTTRYLVNDACFWAKKPLVCAAIQQFEGQATVIKPGDSACYRCIFPTPPPPDMVPS